MITPSFSLTATERVLPRLALDFTTASLDARVTFTRTGNTATVTNSSGNIVGINANLPRFDYNPTTLVCNGLLIEEARTNALVNSLIDGTNLTTQIVTTTAVAYTLSFYGTGNIVLSGTSSSTQTGSGAYPSRKTFTFTPTAGALTLTVSGTVQYAQLEVGSFATSFIPTTTATLRNADLVSMIGGNFSSWYNATQGTLYAQYNHANVTSRNAAFISDSTTANRMGITTVAGIYESFRFQSSSGNYFANDTVPYVSNATASFAFAYKASDQAAASSARLITVASPQATIPTVNVLYIGADFSGGNQLNGHVKRISYYPQRLTNAELQAITK
jgi:hypothetical protein